MWQRPQAGQASALHGDMKVAACDGHPRGLRAQGKHAAHRASAPFVTHALLALAVVLVALTEATLVTASHAVTGAGPIVYFRNPITGALAKSGSDRVASDVPSGAGDKPFVSLALDAEESHMFYSNGDAIVRADLDGSSATEVVPSVVLYVIGGVNFGPTATSLIAVEIHGVACTSIHYWSSTQVGCVTSKPAHNDVDVTVFDVTVVSTAGGRGISSNDPEYAEQRAASGFSTPIVSSVRRVVRSSAPRALAYDAATSTLLWSDTESGTIHRSDANGDYIQLVATGLFEVYGMAAAADHLFYTDHNEGRVVRVNLTAAGDMYDDPELAGVTTSRVVDVATGGIITGVGTSDRARASKTLLRGFTGLRGIALDVPSGHMYLTEASGNIYRARMDGAFGYCVCRCVECPCLPVCPHPAGRNMQKNPRKRKVYARAIIRRPSSARLDGIAVTQGSHGANPRRVFWTESNTNAVFSATVYGADITQLAGQTADMVWPRAIALLHEEGSSYVDNHLFWTQYIGRVHRSSTTGENRQAIVDDVQSSGGFAMVESEVSAAQIAGTPTLFNVE